MDTIQERLPNPSDTEEPLAVVLNQFDNLLATVAGFSSANLDAVLAAGSNLPIPDSFVLIQDSLNQLGKMANVIPSNPEELTASLREGLEQLTAETNGLQELIEPLTNTLELLDPLLEQFEFLLQSVESINTIISGVSEQVGDLNPSSLSQQLELFSNLFTIFPEAAEMSPLKELKDQIETLKDWLVANGTELTESFRSQIQTLADALPTQLNQISQAGLAAIAAVEVSVANLDNASWCDPYNQALDEVAAIDLENLSLIDNYLTVLDTQVAQVTSITQGLLNNAETALDGLDAFNIEIFGDNLRDAFLELLSVINPDKPSVLAGIFSQIRKMMGGLEVSGINLAIEQLERQIDQRLGGIDFSKVTETLEAIVTRIGDTVDIVDGQLVQVATLLSNLVRDLQGLLGSVNLTELVSQIQAAFTQLSNQAATLFAQINAIPQEIDSFINTLSQDIQAIDIQALEQGIRNLLNQITAVLDDPQIRHLREEAQQGIEQVAQNLEAVTLKPVFDRVIDEIENLETKLAEIDVSQLNELLKNALKEALDQVIDINFTEDVAADLIEEFQQLLSQSVELIQPLEEKYLEIVGQINQFDPGALVSEQLAQPFADLVSQLNTIEPSQILAPLQALYEALLGQLKPLSPSALLAPLTQVHGQLTSALSSLSPQQLIAPLNQRLAEMTAVLDQLGLEAFISQITDSVSKINTLISSLSLGEQLKNSDFWTLLQGLTLEGNNLLQDASTQVDQFLDQLIAQIPDLDMSVLQPVLDALKTAIATVESHLNTPAVLNPLNQLAIDLDREAFNNCLTNLTQRWLAQKARFEAVTPPPELVDRYEDLKARVNQLSPFQLLATPAVLVEQLEGAISNKQTQLLNIQQGLVSLLADNRDQLSALLPAETTVASFKQLLRQGLEEQIGQPAKDLLRSLNTKLTQLSEALEALVAIGLKFKAPSEFLTLVPDSIEQIGETLIAIKNKITGINLNFLADELQGVIDQVLTQLGSLEPSALVADLESLYQNLLTTLEGLYPAAALDSIDQTYQDGVLTKIAELDPAKTIGEPLTEEYQKILKLQEELNITQIFAALESKLNHLGQELEDGLASSETAFDQMLAAVPL